MAFGLPLTKEVVDLLLTAIGAAVLPVIGGAWMLGKSHTSGQISTLKTENNFLKLRADTAETDLDKLKVSYERSHERGTELILENARFRAELEALSRSSGAPEVVRHSEIVTELKARLEAFDRLKDALLGAEDELWKLRTPSPPEQFETRMRQSRAKVLLVANLKGGVGKTTLVANLAGHFAHRRSKRVLVIDLDYQGSLTRMMVLGAHLPLGGSILADTMLSGDATGAWVTQAARELNAVLPKAKLITCGQRFDGAENRILLRWLLGEMGDDVRYRLARILLSDAVQEEFDLVLIDAPPRLSLGTVTALCASHAIVIPTVADALSVDGVVQFLQRANLFRPLNPALEQIGIVACLTDVSTLRPYEQKAMDDARLALAHWNGKGQVFKRNIRYFASLSKTAGRTIGYVEDADVKTVFDELGKEIGNAWQL